MCTDCLALIGLYFTQDFATGISSASDKFGSLRSARIQNADMPIWMNPTRTWGRVLVDATSHCQVLGAGGYSYSRSHAQTRSSLLMPHSIFHNVHSKPIVSEMFRFRESTYLVCSSDPGPSFSCQSGFIAPLVRVGNGRHAAPSSTGSNSRLITH